MKFIKIAMILVLMILIWASCSRETSRFFNASVIIQNDSLQVVPGDSLIFTNTSIELIAIDNKDTSRINGDLLQIDGSMFSIEDSICSRHLHYILKNDSNRVLSEIRLADSDGKNGYESIYRNGDISLIPEDYDRFLTMINSIDEKNFRKNFYYKSIYRNRDLSEISNYFDDCFTVIDSISDVHLGALEKIAKKTEKDSTVAKNSF